VSATIWLAWGIAVLVAVVVLGFCLYEIAWKAKRLRKDLAQLESLAGDLDRLRAELSTLPARVPMSQTQRVPMSQTQRVPMSQTQRVPMSQTQRVPMSQTQPTATTPR
jgi:hypothetical protein